MLLLLFVALLLAPTLVAAQSDEGSYNYRRAMEAVNAGNNEEALRFFEAEVRDNPKNGMAYLNMAYIHMITYYDCGKTLTNAAKAIKNLSRKNKKDLLDAHYVQSLAYACLGDTANALDVLGKALDLDPEYTFALTTRARLYVGLGDYAKAMSDANALVRIDDGLEDGHDLLCQIALKEERYEDAVRHATDVIKRHSGNVSAYQNRARAHIALKRYKDAALDVVGAMAHNESCYEELYTLADSAFHVIRTILMDARNRQPKMSKWPFYLGAVYQRTYRYAEAAEYYEASYELDQAPKLAYLIAGCCKSVGDFEKAIRYGSLALEADPSDDSYFWTKFSSLVSLGRYTEALEEVDAYAKARPGVSYVNGYKAIVMGYMGDLDGAIAEYSALVRLMPDDSYLYMDRGEFYEQKGLKEQADADFRKVLELTADEERSFRHMLCEAYLGDEQKHESLADEMERMLKENIEKRGCAVPDDYSSAADIYAVMGRKDDALRMLRKAVEVGFADFQRFRHNPRWVAFRKDSKFNALIDGYEAKVKERFAKKPEAPAAEMVTDSIPFVWESGVCKVRCEVNGLPLFFYFDTGASDVTLSSVEGSFMFKNGYLSKSDVVGRASYGTADGSVHEGTKLNLRKVKFGNFELDNVEASIVDSQYAPLLLGQSLLSKLGKVEVDYAQRVIKITYAKK